MRSGPIVLYGLAGHSGRETICPAASAADAVCATLEEGRKTAISLSKKGSVVLSVKTWR